jgi:Flp pilus assembly protein TadG
MTRRARLASRMMHLARRMRRDHRGVAAVEFAMIFPIMSMLFIGAIEFSQALTVDRRVTQSASSVADLIARAPESGMTAAEIDGAMRIIEQLVAPYDVSRLTVKIISVRATASGGGLTYTVDWSRDSTGGTPYARGSTYTGYLDTSLLDKAGSTVIIGEATYNYVPLIFHYFITEAFDLKEEFFLKPRNASCVILKGVMATCA